MTPETALAATTARLLRFTPEQRELIHRQCMPPGCTSDELALFIHVAEQKGLDPIQREIHCTKVGGKLQFIADINGLQGRAAKESDYEGMDQAVVYERDEFLVDRKTGEILKHVSNPFTNGKPVGAWAMVFRKNMRPFRSMARFSEYENASNPLWRTKPSVMIEKVAKSVALRLAYPVQLGGVYERAEMDKIERELNPPPARGLEAIPSVSEPKALPAPSPISEYGALATDELRTRVVEAEAWCLKNAKSRKLPEAQQRLAALQAELTLRDHLGADEPPPPLDEDAPPSEPGSQG